MPEDPDEHPSIRRAAGWTLNSWLDLGIVGAVWTVLVAVCARARRRRWTASP